MKQKNLIIKTFDKKIKPKSQFINEKQSKFPNFKKKKEKKSQVKIDIHKNLDR